MIGSSFLYGNGVLGRVRDHRVVGNRRVLGCREDRAHVTKVTRIKLEKVSKETLGVTKEKLT